ncbi:MAG: phospho-sugar mutase [Acidimicrobiaceae bacterium]|nr:phospho-sugar mutase [Acidimicrobiaceae bacterium]
MTSSARPAGRATPARRRAAEWLAADPDPETGAELQALLAGDPVDLERRFEGRLAFGTAGMRGPMGAGPLRMNRVLVRMVAAALAERVLQERDEQPRVVVGYDARHRSDLFAADTARVLAARQVPVTMLPGPVPTPVLAFAVKHLDASAGVMVTASHNPRADNGCKVYRRGGRQLAAPVDAEISRIIDRTVPPAESDLASGDDPQITDAGDDVVEAYLEAVSGLLAPGGPRSVRIAYTPLHGVGASTFLRALSLAGFDPPSVVAGQAEPDPDFPTAPFPNPEETGVLDPLMQLAAETGADVALAHDPDADRLAVAVPCGGRWRPLTGDETGCLLAEHLLRRDGAEQDGRHRLVINTVVSSRLLRSIAADHGADWTETLTGFKWIMAARSQRAASHDLVLGYEEALGYAVGDVVSDKDGIGAALVMAELVADLKTEGRTLSDLLDDLHRRHGVHASGQRSIRFESASRDEQPMERAMAALREAPPAELAGAEVTAVHDLAAGSGDLPPADVVVLELSGIESRVIVRPSGTELKMKVYGEAVVAPPAGGGGEWLRTARVEARTTMAAVLDAAARHVADPERQRSGTRGRTPQ